MPRISRARLLNRAAVRRYQATEKGRRANLRYARSAKSLLYKRLWKKHLSASEEKKARAALENFNGRCDACGSSKTSKIGWHIDHKRKRFRGILCHQCNVALAFVSDSILRCKKLIQYLKDRNE